MENLKKIADELRVQIQDEWTMGSPRTSSATYKELQPYNPQSLAGSYVATYADYICNQNSLFWRTINTKIATILGYYNEANDYLKRESYRVSTRHVAQCLRHTSLAYIMNLIYYGLLQNSITPKHIQQVQGIPSDEKGIGLQIAGIDVEEYNELLKSIKPTAVNTKVVQTTNTSEKRKLSVVKEMSEVYQSVVDSMLGYLTKNRLISYDAASQPTFNGSCDLYAYMVWKMAERVNIQRISWDAILSILPPKERTDKKALKDKVSDYRKQKVKKMPRGANLIDAAIKLYIRR